MGQIASSSKDGKAPAGSRCSELLEGLNAQLDNELECDSIYDKYVRSRHNALKSAQRI